MATKTGKPAPSRAGKTFLNIEIDPALRERLNLAARHDGKCLKDWFGEFLDRHLPVCEIVVRPRP